MSNEVKSEKLSLKDVCTLLDISAGVIRKATHDYEVSAKLHSFDPSEPIVGLKFERDPQNGHLLFDAADVEVYGKREKRAGGGQRGDGKKYLVRLTAEQVAQFKAYFPSVELGDPYAYNKQYQKARKEKEAAEAVE